MIPSSDSQVYTDIQGLTRLKAAARDNPDAALRVVAEQFEAIFTQMMLKNMREASLGEGAFDNDQSKLYQEMFDKQISVTMSKNGMGLADIIVRQLGGKSLDKPGGPQGLRPVGIRDNHAYTAPFSSPQDFVNRLGPIASEVGNKHGISPKILLSQAALETGWGKSMITHPGGNSSHNLFGIKADARWNGERVFSNTLEYKDGIAVKSKEAFRSYDSFKQSFEDYVKFLGDNPRYEAAINHVQDPEMYFHELQMAGYATDPHYADKINAILGSEAIVNSSLSIDESVDEPVT